MAEEDLCGECLFEGGLYAKPADHSVAEKDMTEYIVIFYNCTRLESINDRRQFMSDT